MPGPTVKTRVAAGPHAMFSKDLDTSALVGQTVPLLVDDTRVGEGTVRSATVVDGFLEVELEGVPTLWQRLHAVPTGAQG